MVNRTPNSTFVLIWLVIVVAGFHDVKATLKTTFMEDLCYNQKSVLLNLRYQPTGILMSLPERESTQLFDCEVILFPPRESSVVLSIYSYDVSPHDSLIIEDSDRFKITLTGYGNFKDEKKAFISDGRMVIKYRRNTTESSHTRQGFQFTYTAAEKKSSCYYNEFRCRNQLCILRDYVCDGHNHCGDGSDQKKCVLEDDRISTPKQDTTFYRNKSNSNIIWISIIGAAGAAVFIIVIVFIVVVVRRSNLRKTKTSTPPEGHNQNSGGGVPLQSVSSTVPQQPPTSASNAMPSAPPAPEGFSFYNRVRRSLRGLKNPKPEDLPKETVTSEVYQVPSMYPNLDQPEITSPEGGVENPDFKIDE